MEQAGEVAVKQIGEEKIKEEGLRRAKTDPGLILQEQKGEAMLEKLIHDPSKEGQVLRKKAGISPQSFEGPVVGGLAIWTAVGAAVTCGMRGSESAHPNP